MTSAQPVPKASTALSHDTAGLHDHTRDEGLYYEACKTQAFPRRTPGDRGSSAAPSSSGFWSAMSGDFSLFDQFRDRNIDGADSAVAMSGVSPEIGVMALGEIPGVGHATAVKLYDDKDFGSLFTANRDEVHWIAGNAGIATPHAFTDAFLEHRDRALALAHEEFSRFQSIGIELILENDPRYPARLRGLPDRPRWLFVRGNLELLSSDRLITVVGTREPTTAGAELASRVASVLVDRGFALVSGLAEGIDAVVHKEVVDRKGQTVAVLGTGIFNDFPAQTAYLRTPILQNGGTIVTEFFPKEQYSRQRFVQRNRIQAGLSEITIPVEAKVPSGTLHTIRFARQYNRMVLGVKWAGADETALHEFLRENHDQIVEVPQSDDPFLEAVAAKYNYLDFARQSQIFRRNSQIERVIKFARSVIRSEHLQPFEIERMMKAIRAEEPE
jgi:DNA protecting protein DprA